MTLFKFVDSEGNVINVTETDINTADYGEGYVGWYEASCQEGDTLNVRVYCSGQKTETTIEISGDDSGAVYCDPESDPVITTYFDTNKVSIYFGTGSYNTSEEFFVALKQNLSNIGPVTLGFSDLPEDSEPTCMDGEGLYIVPTRTVKPKEYWGLSTSTKPTTGFPPLAIFHEVDTGDDYYFDGEKWTQIGA